MGTEIESFSATSMAAAAGAVDAVWGGVAPKRCDSCKTGAAATFCGADTAYLCLPCDGRIHRAKQSRVWMCEVCEQAPAAVTCKADAAALCVACDFDIHSANPVAHRHERIPIEPFVGSYAENRAYPIPEFQQQQQQYVLHNENGAAAGYSVPGGISWTQLESGFPELNQKQEELERKDRIFGEMDELLELEYGDLLEGRFQQSYSSDGVVPAQSKPAPAPLSQPGAVGLQFLLASREYGLDQLDFTQPNKLSSFGYPTQTCLSNSVSSSSHEAGVVPEGSCSNNNNNSMSEISFSFPGNNMTTCSSSSQQPAGVAKSSSSTDREARVMRYREKRKNRKFEKTIRYASRKAYAETRPRIKGRFAKRCSENNSELTADHLEELLYGSSSSASASADSIPFFGGVDSRYGYGVVPSFR